MSAPVCMQLLPPDAAARLQEDPRLCMAIGFDSRGWHSEDCRRLTLPLPPLGRDKAVEVWLAEQPMHPLRREQGLCCEANEQLLHGCLWYDEARHGGIEQATRAAYGAIRDALSGTGFGHLLRIWHFFPRINEEENGLERYRAFCRGRHDALVQWDLDETRLPAATAIGSHGDGLLIHFLAARSPGIQIENPRQVSAYCYPQQYGPRSPTFSRATLMPWPDGHRQLFISGTASIVGHETRHAGDLEAQLDETLTNIRSLIDVARGEHDLPLGGPEALDGLRIYLRHAEDAPRLEALLHARLPDSLPRVILHGDICRSDLLLEIEGSWTGCKD
ncbi:MAG: hypothetical protein D6717_14190 [Gammaproteobacteria bacterium]|nr:MAG: hypothetical protein D6717_14190 [Gammaproteobacteria bacterium]